MTEQEKKAFDAMRDALDRVSVVHEECDIDILSPSLADAVVEAIAAAEAVEQEPATKAQEPVAWMVTDKDGWARIYDKIKPVLRGKDMTLTPLYAAAEPARQPLTDEQIEQAAKTCGVAWTGYREDAHGFYTIPVLLPYHYQFARAIESAIRDMGQP